MYVFYSKYINNNNINNNNNNNNNDNNNNNIKKNMKLTACMHICAMFLYVRKSFEKSIQIYCTLTIILICLKNCQVGEKWVSDDCSYLCKGLS
jgi:hypothetical protein